METTVEEHAVILAAHKGDRAAFGDLVQAYQRRAFAAAYSILGNRDEAMEVAQESFIRAYKGIHRFDTTMPFYPWLYRIVKNTSLNHIKKKKRRGESSLDSMMETGFDVTAAGRSPRGEVELDDLQLSIRDAMAELTEDQREILKLRHFMELSYLEIAELLDIPKGTVMSRLHGARKALKRVIESRQTGEAALV